MDGGACDRDPKHSPTFHVGERTHSTFGNMLEISENIRYSFNEVNRIVRTKVKSHLARN